ncbi:MAG TPA: GNAT family N-acetyltransferase, partial [Micromonosporaceae bacterium]|nr:GNAT family N-acetyltransferase [Micromonosporaceae bacterium]
DRVGELPRPADRELPADGRALLVAVPGDIEARRRADPTTAKIWRYAVREALTGALGAGYRITGMSRDGFYVLEAKP